MSELISREEISEAVVFNDVNNLVVIMEKIGLCNDGSSVLLPADGRNCVSLILSYAAAGAYRKDLTREMALKIIEYTSCMVDFFDFASAVTYASDCILKNDNMIPDGMRNVFRESVFVEKYVKTIEEFSVSEFKRFLAYITNCDEVESIDPHYKEPIIRYIYKHELVTPSLLFALMGSHLKFSSEEEIMHNAIFVPITSL